jgi:uncharacterized membrane protein YfcA
MTVIGVIFILLVALIFSPLGLGGGVLYVPIFHYLLDWSLEESLIGSLSIVFMVALGSSISHLKEGHADNHIANIGRLTAIPGVIVGTLLASLMLDMFGDIIIKILATLILAFIIERTLRVSDQKDNFKVGNIERKNSYRFGTGFAGIASGLLGIGGGAILVTLNRNLLGMDSRKAAGTSYLIGVTIVPIALLSHILIDGTISIIIEKVGVLYMVLIPTIALFSSIFGSRYAIKHIPKYIIARIFLFAISLSLLRYLIDIVGNI